MSWDNTLDIPSHKPFCIVHVRIRPQVPQHLISGLPWICSLGIYDACAHTLNPQVHICWPYRVEVELYYERLTFDIVHHGGCDEGGVFVDLDIICQGDTPTVQALPVNFDAILQSCLMDRITAWQHALSKTPAVAGPLAFVASEYFDHVDHMGHAIAVHPKDGSAPYTATFAGVDVWGRAVVTLNDATERTLAPEQASLCASL